MLAFMNAQEDLTIWANAYNAALTGILSTIKSQPAAASGDIANIAGSCRAFADQALKDAQAHR